MRINLPIYPKKKKKKKLRIWWPSPQRVTGLGLVQLVLLTLELELESSRWAWKLKPIPINKNLKLESWLDNEDPRGINIILSNPLLSSLELPSTALETLKFLAQTLKDIELSTSLGSWLCKPLLYFHMLSLSTKK